VFRKEELLETTVHLWAYIHDQVVTIQIASSSIGKIERTVMLASWGMKASTDSLARDLRV
jgi:hypothetical protein